MSQAIETVINTDNLVTTVATNKVEPKNPELYVVVLLNDDTTPVSVVTDVLEEVFKKPKQVSTLLMLKAHRSGKATINTYTKEIGETLINNAVNMAIALCQEMGRGCELRFALEPA